MGALNRRSTVRLVVSVVALELRRALYQGDLGGEVCLLEPGQLSGRTLPKPLTWSMVCHLLCDLFR